MNVRHVVHAAVLVLANLTGILVGFVVFWLASTTNQLAVQLPIAVAVTGAAFLPWVDLVAGRGPVRLRWRGSRDGAWTYGLAPVIASIVFVPLHYSLEGYLTAFSNLVALWSFQLVVNAPVIVLAIRLTGCQRAQGQQRRPEDRHDAGRRQDHPGDDLLPRAQALATAMISIRDTITPPTWRRPAQRTSVKREATRLPPCSRTAR